MTGQVDLQQECTVYVRNLDARVTDKLLEELFTQVGPVNYVTIRDSQQQHRGAADTTPKAPANRYAFVEFADVESVLFACEVMDAVEIYGQKLKVQPRDNTLQKGIFMQMNMNAASWERHHSSATNSPIADKGRTSARHSDIGVYNELERQSSGTGGGKRIVSFSKSHGAGGGQFAAPPVPLFQPQKMRSPPSRRSFPKDRQQREQTWSPYPTPSNFSFPSGGPFQQMRFDSPSAHHFQQQSDGRRFAPYPARERGHMPREYFHGSR